MQRTITFSEGNPQQVIPVTLADGGALDLTFRLAPPPSWVQPPGRRVRLLHARLAGKPGPPRESELFELVISANGQLVVEIDGFGPKRPEHRPPLKLGRLPDDGRYHIEHTGAGDLEVNGAIGRTHLQPAGRIELVFGIDNDNPGAELVAPIGWTLEIADEGGVGEPPAPPVGDPPPPPRPPSTELHPSVAHFVPLFASDHLPQQLREISQPFGELAANMIARFGGQGIELAAGLRKLLEAKDCMVRAAVAEQR